ncbi:type II CRISPR RNA-guided endonuclease Cas9 [Deminuibacter soli]|uniref:CRISPR-associated endonuclease Cas9 n=1 Tax=Deminuibacter soli TaxID=2291815 RepID=A0A3E1NGQ7_9BACT|nr:type II CRISPR RNA-guided endonuclease Cas9 [Deminuibacter soli]RFM27129.1 type II CRISPR RNA-guided endonuclease Cas9 [Deminuibacter soli]
MNILGLDIGVSSIGWALINFTADKWMIRGMGTRIIPLNPDDKDEFTSGNTISKNQKRTQKRTQRKGYDRYQLRRKQLILLLQQYNMMPDNSLIRLSAERLYGLRTKALREQLTLEELGRVLLHLNQKRGYKSSRSDTNLDKKDTDYVTEVKNRHQQLKEKKETIGTHFHQALQANQHYRIKQQVFPREAYIEEFDAIIKTQQQFYSLLTPTLIEKIRNETVYYQRNLKSQKDLVSICELEGFATNNTTGKTVQAGPRVAPRSSPLAQACKIWETINTLSLQNKYGETYLPSQQQKLLLFNYLDNNELLTQKELFKLLGLKKEDGWYANKQITKGLQGNITKTLLLKQLKNNNRSAELLRFDLQIETGTTPAYLTDKKTGEVLATSVQKQITRHFENEPLYKLWHTTYAISDVKECTQTLIRQFAIDETTAKNIANIDFRKFSFANKSAKAMRKIIPHLIDGHVYSTACAFAGYNHSNSLTSDERLQQLLADKLDTLPKNSLRQPIVEKILNQLINLVNDIIAIHGRPDEIRIELARELKQSKEERNNTFMQIAKRERENKAIIDRIEKEYGSFGVRATRNTIIKWRLFHEINGQDVKTNATCIYCGKQFGITDALQGNSIDVEHIIPKSKLFDDSQSNKTLTHRRCNEDKDNRTAYDFMKSKGDSAFSSYLQTIDHLYNNKIINKTKRDKLLMPADKIPQDFIDRQLRETQYISRKAKELLEKVCYNVWTTSGSVTAYLRHIWGWDDVLVNLQLPKYRELGLTEYNNDKEIINGWSKRDDHRHHAIDALTIACTRQGFIHRINTLNAQSTRDNMYNDLQKNESTFNKRKPLLEAYLAAQRPFTTIQLENVVSSILISFKSGKKSATTGKRKVKIQGSKKVVQTGIIIPRGALSEDTVYGKIKVIEKEKPVKYLFENPDLIFKPYIRKLVEDRLKQHNNDTSKALLSLKKEAIYLDEAKTKILQYGTCFKEEYVVKYPIESIKIKDIPYIIDRHVQRIVQKRLEQFDNKEKDVLKDLQNNPIWHNEEKRIPVRSVRCLTGLSIVEPVKQDEKGNNIGFVKPGNNHHAAIYIDANGKKQEHICSFWHAVERKKYGIPVIITQPAEIWNIILSSGKEYPQSFLEKLPNDQWQFLQSLQQNEMFIIGLSQEDIVQALQKNDKKTLSPYLFRVRKLTAGSYWFLHHLETQPLESTQDKKAGRVVQASASTFKGYKVKITITGDITQPV